MHVMRASTAVALTVSQHCIETAPPHLSRTLCCTLQLYATLKRLADAQPRHLDCWDVSITAPDASYFPELPYALAPAPNKVGCAQWRETEGQCAESCHCWWHRCCRFGAAAFE